MGCSSRSHSTSEQELLVSVAIATKSRFSSSPLHLTSITFIYIFRYLACVIYTFNGQDLNLINMLFSYAKIQSHYRTNFLSKKIVFYILLFSLFFLKIFKINCIIFYFNGTNFTFKKLNPIIFSLSKQLQQTLNFLSQNFYHYIYIYIWFIFVK